MITFDSRISLKKDTKTNWEQNNPVLLDGEIIIVQEDSNLKLKIGNGYSTYSQLPFIIDNNWGNF